MAVYLNELQAGATQDVVGFPHLVVCMGVVLQTAHWLYGFHFSTLDANEKTAFANYLAGAGANAANGVRLYGCCDWGRRYQQGYFGGRAAWKTEMRAIAAAINYQGEAAGFDTSIIAPADGTYVEYQPEFAQQRCRIFYKRNEKTTQGTSLRTTMSAAPGGNFYAYQNTGAPALVARTVRANAPLVETTSVTVTATPNNGGQLHELNYFLRLVTFTI